jgi:3-phosphoshikimate 1-carboxyvinyltransferase
MSSQTSREFRVHRGRKIHAEIEVPGDKSISHRSLMFAALTNGPCEISGFLPSEDCLSTMGAMRALGVQIDEIETDKKGRPTKVVVHGCSGKFKAPENDIDCGNSGTSMRLLAGLLAAQPFDSRLTGDESLSRRPMRRVMDPLAKMGADITSEGETDCAPLRIRGRKLEGIEYKLPMASAQVKSAILIAGLFAKGKTTVIEPTPTRDHTERMLQYFRGKVVTDGPRISTYGGQTFEYPGTYDMVFNKVWYNIYKVVRKIRRAI